MEEAAAPFRWLNENRGIGGGYGSTQVKTTRKPSLSVSYLYLRYVNVNFFPSVHYGGATGPV